QRLPLDERFPEWGESPYFRVTLSAAATVHDVLSHLYVLLPVLDDRKHYYIGDAEVAKLMRHGEGWLKDHPERQFIAQRYLQRRRSLVEQALQHLLVEEQAEVEAQETASERAAEAEKALERPLTLHTQRILAVAARLNAAGAKRV